MGMETKTGHEIVCDLRDALNRIIHAQKLEINYFNYHEMYPLSKKALS